MAFCTLDQVTALTKPRDPYNADEQAEVNTLMEQIASHMRVKLRGAGYSLPISSAEDLKYLALVNSWGTAGLAERQPGASNNSGPSDTAIDYWKLYIEALDEMFEGKIGLESKKPGTLPRALHTSFAADGSDPEISDNTPWFRRDMVG